MPFINIPLSGTVPGPVGGLSITTSSYNLNLTWQPPVYPNGVLTAYQVTVTNLINTTEAFSYTVDPFSHELIIDSGIRKSIISLLYTHFGDEFVHTQHEHLDAKVTEYNYSS